MNTPLTGAVILGAGFSRRFGNADKRLARLPDGRTVAETTVAIYCEAFSACRVVLRTDDDELAEILRPFTVELVFTADAAAGMGHSLSAGVQNIDWDWTFVALLDMPWVSTATLCELIAATTAEPAPTIVQPLYRARPEAPAHPVGFARSLLPELAATHGDQGARSVVQAHRETTVRVASDDAGLVRDIDSPEDIPARG